MNENSINKVDKFVDKLDPTLNDWIISYYSTNRLKFEFVTCVLIIYDAVMAPFIWAY